jgi:hypothetical protein
MPESLPDPAQDVLDNALAGCMTVVNLRHTAARAGVLCWDFMTIEINPDGAGQMWRESAYSGRLTGDTAGLLLGNLIVACGGPITLEQAEARLIREWDDPRDYDSVVEFVRHRVGPAEWGSSDEEWAAHKDRFSVYWGAK